MFAECAPLNKVNKLLSKPVKLHADSKETGKWAKLIEGIISGD